jgi:hypothetical protein
MAAIDAVIGPLLIAIGKISTGISALIKLWPALKGMAARVNAFCAANPILLIAAAIIALVALIATKGDEIQAKLQEVDDFLQNIFSVDWEERFGFLGTIMNLFSGIFKSIWDSIKSVLDGVIDFIRGVFTGDWDRAWKGIQEIFGGVFIAAEGIFDAFSNFLKNIFEKDWSESLGAVGNILNGFFANVKNIWEDIEGVFRGIIDFVKNIFEGNWAGAWESVKSIFKSAFDALVDYAKAPLNLIIGLVNGLIDGLNWLVDGINKISFEVPNWVPEIGGKKFGFNLGHIGKIAYLANGGILERGSAVVGEDGPELLTMSGGGAVVQPLTNNTTRTTNLGGINVTIYAAPGQDTHELVEMLMDEVQAETERRMTALA